MQEDDDEQSADQSDSQCRLEPAKMESGPVLPKNHHQTKKRKNRGRNPRGRHFVVQTQQEINQENRRAHAEEINQLRIIFSVPPKSNRCPDGADEKNWIQQHRLQSEEI